MSILQLVLKPPSEEGTEKDLVQETDRYTTNTYQLCFVTVTVRSPQSRGSKYKHVIGIFPLREKGEGRTSGDVVAMSTKR